MKAERIPTATYRLQFHHGFNFSQAWPVVMYLHELGISDIYASPLFKARKGSLHGYSVTNVGFLLHRGLNTLRKRLGVAPPGTAAQGGTR